VSLFGALMAVFLGVTGLTREIERRTAYTILARPITRASFVVGKYVGLCLVLAVNVSIMGVLVFLVTLLTGEAPGPAYWGALWLSLLELALIGAFATAFACYSGATLSVIFTLAIFLVGSLSSDMLWLVQRSKSEAVKWLATGIYYTVPDLKTFSLRLQVANDFPVPPGYLVSATGYGVAYIAVVLTIAVLVFARRELT
jgi:Cu-processing system permease protein